ncbi:MAG TPA: NAD(P)-dependent oxidoreductase, partial [Anaerolineales bacterium]|nr:NAD(P)-dependent oxidoreductase [Anaerolineales bacterium]
TGATGNLGGHVLPLLLERGHNVRCLVFDSKNERKIVQGWKHKPEVLWGDIQDERVVESALGGVEAVIHLAAIIPPMTDQNPRLAYGVNVNGTRNLVNAASKQTKRVRFIFTSTYDVYGNTQDQTPPRKVTLPVNPQEEYARHKVEAEKIIQSSNVDWCIFRLASAIPVEMSTKYQSMMFDVPLDDRLEYIHPADAALAICNAVEHAEVWGKVMHLGGGPRCQLRERDIVQGAFETIGIGALPEEYFSTQSYYTDWLDTEESQRLLNYQRYTFADHLESLKKSLGWQIPFIKLFSPLIRYFLVKQSKYQK